MKSVRPIKRYLVPLLFVLVVALLSGCSDQIIVLDPKGPIGESQKDLIYIATILCLIVVVPVIVLTGIFAWRYRDKPGNNATYKPNWSHNTKLETIWWGIPVLIIIALGIVTVSYTYKLEPSKPLVSEKKPITIQVTSLDWKWLFKYPEQGIATVNYAYIPEDTPVRFQLTADSPMNSFWIPQLGGQIYAMSGMAMTLFLQADEPGEYYGSGANFTGRDFAQMTFKVHATSDAEFNDWVKEVKSSSPALTEEGYAKLAEPGSAEKQAFSSFPAGLFESIVTKYAPGGTHHQHGSADMGMPQPPDPGKQQQTASTADNHMAHSSAGH
ncbi:ubiquinol oxidase subunit II [Paenibacillus sp. J31TS4]|uniref:ubiquinol oxidase subunit II n=1 Tax=Paenibacillus sp. J31TS4 TaxID=2807195 RepID=UPI001BCDC2D0|nr:ubiquinol oxidase subunit II [Paenibacillus sp. J31TS4]